MNDRLLSMELLEAVAQVEAPRCLSIYLPTHPRWPDSDKDPVQFANLIGEAKHRLTECGLESRAVEQLLRAPTALLDDKDFWRHATAGMAYYLGDGHAEAYRLLTPPKPFVAVGETFHLRPAIPTAMLNRGFYVLAASMNSARLIRCTPTAAEEVVVPDMPQSFGSFAPREGRGSALQFHTRAPSGGGRRSAVFHGHGSGTDHRNDQLRRYLNEVQKAVTRLLAGEHAPLAVVAVDHVRAQYVEVNSYSNLVPAGVSGSPDEMSASDLREAGWAVVRTFLEGRQEQDVAAYARASGTNLTSTDLSECLRAAYEGRIRTLFVDQSANQWGALDEATGRLVPQESRGSGSQELLDLTALLTLRMGGTVHAMETERLPVPGPIAALFRFE